MLACHLFGPRAALSLSSDCKRRASDQILVRLFEAAHLAQHIPDIVLYIGTIKSVVGQLELTICFLILSDNPAKELRSVLYRDQLAKHHRKLIVVGSFEGVIRNLSE